MKNSVELISKFISYKNVTASIPVYCSQPYAFPSSSCPAFHVKARTFDRSSISPPCLFLLTSSTKSWTCFKKRRNPSSPSHNGCFSTTAMPKNCVACGVTTHWRERWSWTKGFHFCISVTTWYKRPATKESPSFLPSLPKYFRKPSIPSTLR